MDAQTLLTGNADEIKLHGETKMDEAEGHHKGEMERGARKEEEEEEDEDEAEEEERGCASESGFEIAERRINEGVGGYNRELPPVDDVCPICFDRFIVACRSNCGHWFCASCILQFWMFRSSIQPCKCPLCCCRIVNLRPEISELMPAPAHDDNVEIIKKVHQYNALYISGVLGTFHRMQALPLFMGRVFRVLIDPDGLRCIYYIMRLLGLILGLVYEKGEFKFMANGGLGIQRMFDMGASVAVVFLFLIGMGYRWILRGRTRQLGGRAATPAQWEIDRT